MDNDKDIMIIACQGCGYDEERIAYLQSELTKLGFTVILNINEPHMTEIYHSSCVRHEQTQKSFDLNEDPAKIAEQINE